MTVLYDNKQVLEVEKPVTSFGRFFNRVYKLNKLLPVFPKWTEEWDKYWYKESFLMVLIFSVFFYLLCLYFVFLGIVDRQHWVDFLPVALIWLIVGVVIPSGAFRLIIFILKRQRIID